MPRLTDTYLRWTARHSEPLLPPAPSNEYDFEVDALDLDVLKVNRLIPRRGVPAADALMLEGYLGATPDNPTIAVSLAALELYRTLRLVKPSLSVEGFTKFLCYKYSVSRHRVTQIFLLILVYQIPYRRRFRRAIADSFDVYLTILENLRNRILGALGRNTPHWRVLHGCPACSYKVRYYGRAGASI